MKFSCLIGATPGSAGPECVNRHMPALAQEMRDVNVRSHTDEKATAWARASLQARANVSPWRNR